MRYIDVAIPTPVHHPFTYSVSDDQVLEPGMRVRVPFHRRTAVGICLRTMDTLPEEVDPKKVRSIERVLDEVPSLNTDLIRLMDWMSEYYLSPIGEICRSALPARMMKTTGPKKPRKPNEPNETTPIPQEDIVLNDEQEKALGTLLASLSEKKAKTFLLHGVTGSGKTEVYLNFFKHLIDDGKRCLLLVPEIGLTPQLTGRAAAKFGEKIAVYHSGLTDAQRHEQWMKIKRGDASVVIGTRSALFAPIDDLGAIVVDEEHDGSYKQDEGFLYNARDSAVMRAHIQNIPIILGSATPSLESLTNVNSGKYDLLRLHMRTGDAALPSIEIVDLRIRHDRGELHCLSPILYDAISENLDRGRQTLLYAGRRGFASAVQCTACGEVLTCPNCDIALTLHGSKHGSEYLSCHYCDYKSKIHESCASCGETELMPIGMGTERLEGEIADFFPDARVSRLDSDVLANPKARNRILTEMRSGKIDILIGTQIVTKGHDFPSITLVGVVAADITLALPDFRSPERMFQLITQVSGRAGRGSDAGRVIIQTRQPDHYSLTSAIEYDLDAFATKELAHRNEMHYPPFYRLANIRISSNDKASASNFASKIKMSLDAQLRCSKVNTEIKILGPAPAIIEKIRGRYRWQLLLKAPNSNILSKFLNHVHPEMRKTVPSGVRMNIDVDPINMF